MTPSKEKPPAGHTPAPPPGNGRSLVFLDADTSLPSYLPPHFPLEQVRFVDTAGKPISYQVKSVSQQVD
jgi:hypothetical protein